MPHSQDAINNAEQLINKIDLELTFAQPGSDDSLLPIYALITDLNALEEIDSLFTNAVLYIKGCLDEHLDSAQPFSREIIHNMQDFVTWANSAFYCLLQNGFIAEPFDVTQAKKETTSITEELGVEEVYADSLLLIDVNNDKEILSEFYTEAHEHLTQVETLLMNLETEPKNALHLNEMFRCFHSIKGVSGFLKLIPIQSLTHEIESYLALAQNDKATIDSEAITAILNSRDALLALVEQVSDALDNSQSPTEIIPVSHLIEEIKSITKKSIEGEPSSNPQAPAKEPITSLTQSPYKQASGTTPAQSTSLRVDTMKLDNLLDMVGELVIVQTQLKSAAEIDITKNTPLSHNLNQLSRITKELQNTSLSLRMVLIRPTFQKMGRIVRDLAKLFGKKINFSMSGEDTELNRNIIQLIADPLIHMTRNSLDHGLEPPEERIAAGKSETGNFQLNAYHLGSNIVIEIKDDGRDINHEKILSIAKEKGIVLEDQELTRSEIFQLIFAPGFSTADKVTDISGRGVGMDVVRQNIEHLHGRIEIESKLGKGSTFSIKLPLTTAIIDGLIVLIGDDKFIIPTTSVKIAMKADRHQIDTIQEKAEVLILRGRTIPIIRLHEEFDIQPKSHAIEDGILIIIETTSMPFCIFVDAMIGKQEVVIKNLGEMMQDINGVAGSAILGDGNIALVVDPTGLKS